ncbi:pheromone-regulated membrane protein 10 [Yarrowia lipolytica]|uniref:Pheromone-regulated membrane protein 10 n=1 Tax=Yarrowia lipolytica TaxID=4952 RepID=A0A371C5W9_YARLL|nr:pheromone-regulated membrane protein 10 [Yarrowia lipolytica]RDW39380.1 pheromone-regulated membrane protein 10 [Yarrowia lipolytica]
MDKDRSKDKGKGKDTASPSPAATPEKPATTTTTPSTSTAPQRPPLFSANSSSSLRGFVLQQPPEGRKGRTAGVKSHAASRNASREPPKSRDASPARFGRGRRTKTQTSLLSVEDDAPIRSRSPGAFNPHARPFASLRANTPGASSPGLGSSTPAGGYFTNIPASSRPQSLLGQEGSLHKRSTSAIELGKLAKSPKSPKSPSSPGVTPPHSAGSSKETSKAGTPSSGVASSDKKPSPPRPKSYHVAIGEALQRGEPVRGRPGRPGMMRTQSDEHVATRSSSANKQRQRVRFPKDNDPTTKRILYPADENDDGHDDSDEKETSVVIPTPSVVIVGPDGEEPASAPISTGSPGADTDDYFSTHPNKKKSTLKSPGTPTTYSPSVPAGRARSATGVTTHTPPKGSSLSSTTLMNTLLNSSGLGQYDTESEEDDDEDEEVTFTARPRQPAQPSNSEEAGPSEQPQFRIDKVKSISLMRARQSRAREAQEEETVASTDDDGVGNNDMFKIDDDARSVSTDESSDDESDADRAARADAPLIERERASAAHVDAFAQNSERGSNMAVGAAIMGGLASFGSMSGGGMAPGAVDRSSESSQTLDDQRDQRDSHLALRRENALGMHSHSAPGSEDHTPGDASGNASAGNHDDGEDSLAGHDINDIPLVALDRRLEDIKEKRAEDKEKRAEDNEKERQHHHHNHHHHHSSETGPNTGASSPFSEEEKDREAEEAEILRDQARDLVNQHKHAVHTPDAEDEDYDPFTAPAVDYFSSIHIHDDDEDEDNHGNFLTYDAADGSVTPTHEDYVAPPKRFKQGVLGALLKLYNEEEGNKSTSTLATTVGDGTSTGDVSPMLYGSEPTTPGGTPIDHPTKSKTKTTQKLGLKKKKKELLKIIEDQRKEKEENKKRPKWYDKSRSTSPSPGGTPAPHHHHHIPGLHLHHHTKGHQRSHSEGYLDEMETAAGGGGDGGDKPPDRPRSLRSEALRPVKDIKKLNKMAKNTGKNFKKRERELKRRRRQEVKITVHIAELLQRQRFILRMCRALMLYGAPTHRLEEYMKMTSRILEIDGQFLYIPGCMIVSFGDATTHTSETQLVRCVQGVNLSKLQDTHEIYKEVVHDMIGVEEASNRLDEILRSKNLYPPWLCVIFFACGTGVVSPYAFRGRWADIPMCIILGSVVGFFQIIVAPRSDLYNNVFEVSMSILISFLARAIGTISSGGSHPFCFAAIAQGSLAIILPGYIVLCGSLELQSKNIVAGSIRMFYAVIYSMFLGFGITLGAVVYGWCDHNATRQDKCPQQLDPLWRILFVPLYSFFIALVNQARITQLPSMLLISGAGYTVTYFVGANIPDPDNSSYLTSAIGAFTIGILGNLYSRLGHGLAFAAMLPGIFVQVPSGVASQGSLVAAIANSNRLIGNKNVTTTIRETIVNSATSTVVTRVQTSLLTETSTAAIEQATPGGAANLGFTMIQVAIGITVGLFAATLCVYPFGKKRSGLFTF